MPGPPLLPENSQNLSTTPRLRPDRPSGAPGTGKAVRSGCFRLTGTLRTGTGRGPFLQHSPQPHPAPKIRSPKGLQGLLPLRDPALSQDSGGIS